MGGLKPSKIAFRQAGGRPRLGHDISLVISTVLFVAIFCFKFHASANNKNATRLYTYMSKGLQGEIIYTLVLGVLPLTTAYQYRNLLGRILLLAKMMIIVNHDCHKYKYEFQKNSKWFVKLNYIFFQNYHNFFILYSKKIF